MSDTIEKIVVYPSKALERDIAEEYLEKLDLPVTNTLYIDDYEILLWAVEFEEMNQYEVLDVIGDSAFNVRAFGDAVDRNYL